MPDFAYVARTTTGQRVEGVLSAGTQREALLALAGKELFPVQVKASGGVRDLDALLRFREAGASRIGTSATHEILDELRSRLRAVPG